MHIALVGDRRDDVRAHVAIPRALELASRATGVAARFTWVPSGDGARLAAADDRYDAVWLVPGSPYASMDGALAAARFARTNDVPFLGTCGGFQHAVLEYARAVLGLAGADHAESNPDAELALIAPLACSLVGKSGHVRLRAGSRLREIYGSDEANESYFCSYGVAPGYQAQLDAGPMRIGAVDDEGHVRAVELTTHRFFVATLFQPELSAYAERSHPIIEALLRA